MKDVYFLKNQQNLKDVTYIYQIVYLVSINHFNGTRIPYALNIWSWTMNQNFYYVAV